MTKKTVCYYMVAGLMALQACKIENDIPYPIVEGNIESFEVEGQCAAPGGTGSAAQINTSDRTVTLYVDDTVDLTKLRITRFTVSSDAEIQADSAACVDYAKFPVSGFEEPDNTADTRVDFSDPVKFTLSTYQDYRWTVNVTQIIDRKIDVTGMIRSVVDPENRVAIIYMPTETDLTNLTVNAMDLGGASGTVTPDPTAIHDYSKKQTFQVAHGWEETAHEWTVYVYHLDEEASAAEAFVRNTSATLTGNVRSGQTVEVDYKEASAADWSSVADVRVEGTSFTAQITGLTGGTSYSYRVNVDGVEGEEQTFTTVLPVSLPNGGFEDWYLDEKIYVPNAQGDNFWGSGNLGAANFIGNITTPTDDAVSGKAAKLESSDALIKLGAGNIFSGDFALDGTNGILHFGQSFSSFPTALRLYYKYTSTIINRIGEEVGSLENLRGRPDSCFIYIALSDKSEPYEIRTRPSTRQMFDKNDKNIIAYGEYISGESTSAYQQITIPLEYRVTNRTPRYIIIVCTASKYGDYFIGGVGSTLWLDEMELIYE